MNIKLIEQGKSHLPEWFQNVLWVPKVNDKFPAKFFWNDQEYAVTTSGYDAFLLNCPNSFKILGPDLTEEFKRWFGLPSEGTIDLVELKAWLDEISHSCVCQGRMTILGNDYKRCDECLGEGELYCSSCDNKNDCKSCKGKGEVPWGTKQIRCFLCGTIAISIFAHIIDPLKLKHVLSTLPELPRFVTLKGENDKMILLASGWIYLSMHLIVNDERTIHIYPVGSKSS